MQRGWARTPAPQRHGAAQRSAAGWGRGESGLRGASARQTVSRRWPLTLTKGAGQRCKQQGEHDRRRGARRRAAHHVDTDGSGAARQQRAPPRRRGVCGTRALRTWISALVFSKFPVWHPVCPCSSSERGRSTTTTGEPRTLVGECKPNASTQSTWCCAARAVVRVAVGTLLRRGYCAPVLYPWLPEQ